MLLDGRALDKDRQPRERLGRSGDKMHEWYHKEIKLSRNKHITNLIPVVAKTAERVGYFTRI